MVTDSNPPSDMGRSAEGAAKSDFAVRKTRIPSSFQATSTLHSLVSRSESRRQELNRTTKKNRPKKEIFARHIKRSYQPAQLMNEVNRTHKDNVQEQGHGR